MITINNLTFAYPHHEAVIENLTISFKTEAIHGIVGLNGCGKTTFFNIITGLYQATSGSILMNNQPLKKIDIAYIDSESFFYPKLTAKEFLCVFPKTNNQFNEEEMVALLKLPLDELIENYSTGMKKKLLILSQIKQDKKLFIFDEPFNGLDIETNKLLIIIMEMLAQKGKTIIVSSHIIEPLYHLCYQIHHLQNKYIVKTYLQSEFNVLEQDVFGAYTSHLKEKLSNIF